MKKVLLLSWLVISAVLTLFAGVELIIGLSLWLKDTSMVFWGPNSITQMVMFCIGIISLIISIIVNKKQNKNA